MPESVGNMKKQGAKIYDLLIALYSRIVLSNALSPEPQYRFDIFNNIEIHIKIARRHILRLAEDIKKQRVKIYELLIALYIIIILSNFLSCPLYMPVKTQLMFEAIKYYRSEKQIITKPVIEKIIERRKWFYDGRWPLKSLITGSDYDWKASFQPDTLSFFERMSSAVFHWNLNPTPPDMTDEDLFVLKSVEMDFLYNSDEKFLTHNK